MKEKKIITLLVLIIIILIGMCLNKNVLFVKEKQIIKEMTQSELETSLNNTINQLNETQKLYAANVDAYKKKVTEAITNQGIPTEMNDSADVVAENIGKILGARTEATATAQDILSGKTAWVNGVEITGTNKGYDIGYSEGYNAAKGAGTISKVQVTTDAGSVKEVLPDIYDQLTVDNFGIGYISASPGRTGGKTGSSSGNYSISGYDATTGTVSISKKTGGSGEIYISSFSAKIYCYYISN